MTIVIEPSVSDVQVRKAWGRDLKEHAEAVAKPVAVKKPKTIITGAQKAKDSAFAAARKSLNDNRARTAAVVWTQHFRNRKKADDFTGELRRSATGKGEAKDTSDARTARDFLQAASERATTQKAPVHRGLLLTPAQIKKFSEGNDIDLPLASWSKDQGQADRFGYGPRGSTSQHVVLHTAPGAKGWDIHKLGISPTEKEVVTGGRFHVDKVQAGHIYLTQTDYAARADAELPDWFPSNFQADEDIHDALNGTEEFGVRSSGYTLSPRSGMVSLDIAPGVIPQVPGGVTDHHITVVYLGKDVDDDLLARVADVARQVAASTPPLSGTISGQGTFAPSDSSDGLVPVYAVPDIPGIDALRPPFSQFNASQHTGWSPHATVAYVEPGEDLPDPVPPTPITFTHLTIHRGNDVLTFPLTGGAQRVEPGSLEVRDWAKWHAEHPYIDKGRPHSFHETEHHAHRPSAPTIEPGSAKPHLPVPPTPKLDTTKTEALHQKFLTEAAGVHDYAPGSTRAKRFEAGYAAARVHAQQGTTSEQAHELSQQHDSIAKGLQANQAQAKRFGAAAGYHAHSIGHGDTAGPASHGEGTALKDMKVGDRFVYNGKPHKVTTAHKNGVVTLHDESTGLATTRRLDGDTKYPMAAAEKKPTTIEPGHTAAKGLPSAIREGGVSKVDAKSGITYTYHEDNKGFTNHSIHVQAHKDGVLLGDTTAHPQWGQGSVGGPVVSVWKYQVHDEGRRQGIARQMVNTIHEQNPDAKVLHSGFVSPEGEKFAESMDPKWNRVMTSRQEGWRRPKGATPSEPATHTAAANEDWKKHAGILAFDPAIMEKVKAKDIQPGDLVATHQDRKVYPAGAQTPKDFKYTATTEKGAQAEHNAATYGGKQTFQRVVAVNINKHGSSISLAGGERPSLGGGNATVYARLKAAPSVEPGPATAPIHTTGLNPVGPREMVSTREQVAAKFATEATSAHSYKAGSTRGDRFEKGYVEARMHAYDQKMTAEQADTERQPHQEAVSRLQANQARAKREGLAAGYAAHAEEADKTTPEPTPKPPPVIEPSHVTPPKPTTTPADSSKYLPGSPKYVAYNAGHARASTVIASNPNSSPAVSKVFADQHEANAKKLPAGIERADTEGMAAAYRGHAESGSTVEPPKPPPRPDYEAQRQVKRDAKNLTVGDKVDVRHGGKAKVGTIKQVTKTRVLVTVPMTTSTSGATERDVWRDKLEVDKRQGFKPRPVIEPGPTAAESHHLAGSLNVGQEVEHPTYGKGRITQLGKDRATVDFAQHGTKSFGASFANHEPKFVEGTAPVHTPDTTEKPIDFTIDHSLDGTGKPPEHVVGGKVVASTTTTTKSGRELEVGDRLANEKTPIKTIESGSRLGWYKVTMEDGKTVQVKRANQMTVYPKVRTTGTGEMLPALPSEKLVEDLQPGDVVNRRYSMGGGEVEDHVGTVKGTTGEGRGRNRQFRVEYEEDNMMPSYHSKGSAITVMPSKGAMRPATPADKTDLKPGSREWEGYNGGHAEALGFHEKQRFTPASAQHALNEAESDMARVPARPTTGNDYYESRRGRHAGYATAIREIQAGQHGPLETRQLADLNEGDVVGKNVFGNDIKVKSALTAVTRTTVKLASKDDKGNDIETEHTFGGDASASLLAEAHQTERISQDRRIAMAAKMDSEQARQKAIAAGSPDVPVTDADKTEGKRQLAHILLRSKTNETQRDTYNSDEEYHRRGYATAGEAADEAMQRFKAYEDPWSQGSEWTAEVRKALMESHTVEEFRQKAPAIDKAITSDGRPVGPSVIPKRQRMMDKAEKQLAEAQGHEDQRDVAKANNDIIDKLAEAIATGAASPSATGGNRDSYSDADIASMRRQVELKINGEGDQVSDVRGLSPNDFARHAAVMEKGDELANRIDARPDVQAALAEERETRDAEANMPAAIRWEPQETDDQTKARTDREVIRDGLRRQRQAVVANAKKVLHDATMDELMKEGAYDREGREEAITGHTLVGTSKTVEDLARNQMRHYPTQWIKNSANGRTLTVRETKGRAHYMETSRSTQALEKKGATGIVSTLTAGKEEKSVALHELGHRMEDTNPGLGALEAAHIETRAVGEAQRHLGTGYGKEEGSKFDQFMAPYAGKLYRSGAQGFHEAFTMGIQSILGEDESTPTYGRLVGIDGAKADPRLRRFVLGALASHANPKIQPAAIQ